MAQGQTMQGNPTFSLGTETILLDFFKKYFKGESEKEAETFTKEAMKVAQIVMEDLKQANQTNIEELEKQAISNIKGELATQDFVRAELSKVETSIAKTRWLVVGVGAFLALLMVIFQPKVFEWITTHLH